MIKSYAVVLGIVFSLVAASVHAQSALDDPIAKRQMCSTLGLAFHNSAAISNENIENMRTRAGGGASTDAFLVPMIAGAQRLSATSDALERRYSKANTPAEVAEAAALSQKPLKPMRDMAALCMK